jgi:hypothetical protein
MDSTASKQAKKEKKERKRAKLEALEAKMMAKIENIILAKYANQVHPLQVYTVLKL